MGDFKEPTALLKKSRGISPVLVACSISDALITQISHCENAAVYAIVVVVVVVVIIIIMLLLLYYP